MPGGILIPAFLATAIVTGRALQQHHRAPYPYELSSTAVIFIGAGLLGDADPRLGGAVAWAYLVALMLRPSTSNLISAISGGITQTSSPKGASA